jgi:3,4-dihydroxy 2-butanone 4-phosphate synthase/GTP cyclohydrolase II
VICEIMNEDGTMARVPDLIEFCRLHQLLMMTVADLIRYRLQHERYIRRVAEAPMRTPFGEFRMIAYENEVDGESHVALVLGDLSEDEATLVRVHTHSLAEDVFGMDGAREVIDGSLRMIAEAGRGAFVYLHSGTRGFAIDRSVSPQRIVFQREQRSRERGEDRTCRTLRQVGLGGQILSDLGIHRIRLLTNTPTHVPALQGFGIEIVEQVPVGAASLSAPTR